MLNVKCEMRIREPETLDYSNFKFDFERLNVYQKAISFVNEVFSLTRHFRWEFQSSLGDQLRRASLSICNNLAEGSNKITRKSKTQFYAYALHSARECILMITLAELQHLISQERCVALRQDCLFICNMLSKLIQSANM